MRPVSVEEFDRYIMLPENIQRSFELIAGEIVEKTVLNSRSSNVALWIMARVSIFVDEHDLGFVSGADGGYIVSGERYIPDGDFIAESRATESFDVAYYPLCP